MSIRKKFKNISRFQTIIHTFTRYGFTALIDVLKLDSLVKFGSRSSPAQTQNAAPVRLRFAFEELGPAFVKLGQVLSMREDLIPDEYVQELRKLQSNVAPFSFEHVKRIVEDELGAPMAECFTSFDETPLASASISQVHRATLSDGCQIALKVQRPNIESVIEADLGIIVTIAHALEHIPEFRRYNPVLIVEELHRAFKNELDFLKEASNTEKFKNNFKDFAQIRVPSIYWESTSKRVLSQAFIAGKNLSNVTTGDIDGRHVASLLFRSFFKQILVDGFFHADLHEGNVILCDNGDIGLIDYGLVGHISRQTKTAMGNMLMAIINEDYTDLAQEYIAFADMPEDMDIQSFQEDLSTLIESFRGLPISEIKFGTVILGFAKISATHHAPAPRELILLGRGFTAMESLIRKLDPNINFIEEGAKLSRDLITQQINNPTQAVQQLFQISRDLSLLVRTLPRQLQFFSKLLNSGNVRVQVKITNLKDLGFSIERAGRLLSGSLIVSALLITSAMLLDTPMTLFGHSLQNLFGLLFLATGGLFTVFLIINQLINVFFAKSRR